MVGWGEDADRLKRESGFGIKEQIQYLLKQTYDKNVCLLIHQINYCIKKIKKVVEQDRTINGH